MIQAQQKSNVLVLCTGNSARSIIVEALFNSIGSHYFQAYSAGSHPTGKVNPFALEQIGDLVINFEPKSKSWDVFSQKDAPQLDLVITVCGNAAQEICPNFMGSPQHIHWGVPDPAAITGSDDDKRKEFANCFNLFHARISTLITLINTRKLQRNTESIPIIIQCVKIQGKNRTSEQGVIRG